MTGFRYFEAPESEMSGLLPGVRRCDLCGCNGRCFNLQQAIGGRTKAETAGCLACLQAGRFGFFHITEAGYLDEKGLTWYDDDEPEQPGRTFVVGPGGSAAPVPVTRPARSQVAVAPSAVEELRRTPDFPTWNEVAWPLHCNDFMVYLGTWQPRDVRSAAAARDQSPRDLFLGMTDSADEHLWPEHAGEWGLTFHVFRCTACGTLRGAIDVD